MRWAILAMILLVVLAAAGVLVAQQSTPRVDGTVGETPGPAGLQIDANSFVGSPVRGEDGKDVGKVSNLMIDAKDGKVSAVVLTMGRTFDVAGTGITLAGKDITVPWEAVKIGREREKVVFTLQQTAVTPSGSTPAASTPAPR